MNWFLLSLLVSTVLAGLSIVAFGLAVVASAVASVFGFTLLFPYALVVGATLSLGIALLLLET